MQYFPQERKEISDLLGFRHHRQSLDNDLLKLADCLLSLVHVATVFINASLALFSQKYKDFLDLIEAFSFQGILEFQSKEA